jgi:hypothetical protein
MNGPLAEALVAGQNRDGGWGAEVGRSSDTEATSLALMALGAFAGDAPGGMAGRAADWLAAVQTPDGSWPLRAGLPAGSWTTSLAVTALSPLPAQRERSLRGARWLLTQEGRKPDWLTRLLTRWLPQGRSIQLDPTLTGWPWAGGSFAWVEPTAYALLALKKARQHLRAGETDRRIGQGEALILDRMCPGGGWNYGNSRVLGEDLSPYSETTAIALIALQDRRQHPAVRTSLETLKRLMAGAESGMALAWSMLCLSVYGEDASRWRPALFQAYERGAFLGSTRTLALAALATSGGARLLRV